MSDRIEKTDQFPDTPEGWQARWEMEFAGEEKEHAEFRKEGEEAEKAYNEPSSLNLFYGDVETKKAALYGNPPAVRAQRSFADPEDQIGRVGALMLERTLNAGVQKKKDPFRRALQKARDDRLLPGLAVMRFRYVVEWEETPAQEAQTREESCSCSGGMSATPMPMQGEPSASMPGMPPGPHMMPDGAMMGMPDPECPECHGTGVVQREIAPAVPAGKRKSHEDAEPIQNTNWRDFGWSPARCWDEVTWIFFRAEMTREDLHARFDESLGAALVETIPLDADGKAKERDDRREDPWLRAAVYEVWHKPSREVFWVVKGFKRVLDRKADPLQLEEFWPCPEPMFANATSGKLIPKSDYAIHKALYANIKDIQARRQDLIDAVGVKGLFDASEPEIKKLLETKGNVLYPVRNMAAFTEKGGVQSAIQWMPLADIVGGIDVLTQKLQEAIQLKDQAVALADVMRGQATPGKAVTATERTIQAHSASTRQRSAQDDFAGFATDARNVQAEIVARWFDAETILKRSSIAQTNDAQYAQQAVELIKSDLENFRIEVAADALAITNYDAVQQERTGALAALGGYFQQSAPLLQMVAPAGPQLMVSTVKMILSNARWLLAGMRGSQAIESEFETFEAAIEQAAKAAMAQAGQPKPPDPQVEKAKLELEGKKIDVAAKREGTALDMQVKRAEFGMDMAKMQAEVKRDAMRAAMPERGPREAP